MSEQNLSRREFVRRVSLGAGAMALAPGLVSGCQWMRSPSAGAPTAWSMVPGILNRIRPPRFPDRDFLVTRSGAVGDGTTDNTEAFRQAIAACADAGGGRVIVPEGRFLTGAIHLRSNVNLHLVRGATIAFSTDPRKYLPVVLTRWEGNDLYGYSAFIYALDQTNIAVTGKGTLDGQANATNWWPWSGGASYGWKQGMPNAGPARDRLHQMAETGVPVEQRVFGEGSYLRPNFFTPYRCTNVMIEGVTIINSPMWEIHPVFCQNVIARDVTIVSHGPNNDGCDPESCRDVLIEGCLFDTGDDCIALKSGRNADGRRSGRPIENVVVRRCQMRDGHGGVTIGSEISGGARYIFAEDCRMDSPNLQRALRIKNNAMRGGLIEHVYMRNVQVGQVADAVVTIDFYYEEGPNGSFPPVVRDVDVRNVNSGKSVYGVYLRGFANAPITNVRLENCDFDNVEKGNVVEQVQGLEFQDVTINGRPAQPVATAQAPAGG